MKTIVAWTCGAVMAAVGSAQEALPLVDSGSLRALITEEALLAKAQLLEDFAYSTAERSRTLGSPGLDASLQYVVDTLTALDYYNVTTQNFTIPLAKSVFSVDGTTYASGAFTNSPEGNVVAPLIPVLNLGCNASDYPAEVSGSIALVARGTCAFAAKVSLADTAGAVGVVLYNNVEGVLTASLAPNAFAAGSYEPTIGISQADGLALVARTRGNGSAVTAELTVTTEDVSTYNIIAQTKTGDAANVLQLGAHIDSVAAGAGLNDDGSGTIGLLEVALALARFRTTNAVRFSWWSAEENGIFGSNKYVAALDQAARDAIRLYLNFDMIGSPNYLIGIYDTAAMAGYMNITVPAGSREAEALWQAYFADEAGLNWQYFNMRDASDHAPFARAGIAFGGLFTGGSEILTEEQAQLFGGIAGLPSDANNHAVGDNFTNINPEALLLATKAIAHAVGTYAVNFTGLPTRSTKREVDLFERDAELRK